MIQMNYGFLKAKIVESCGNQKNFAEKLGISVQSLSEKLNNKKPFKHEEIEKSRVILSLDGVELERCFFIRK